MSRVALAASCAALALLAGCALTDGYKYDAAPVTLSSLSAPGKVSLAVHDARPYVVSGNKPEKFAGLLRGGFGNPFDVSTASGNPVAQDLRDAIARALQQRGIDVVPVETAAARQPVQVRNSLLATRARRHVLLTLHEWKTDSLMRTSLYYDVTVEVLDEGGKALTSRRLRGEDELGGNMMEVSGPQDRIVAGTGKRLSQILSDAQVAAALR